MQDKYQRVTSYPSVLSHAVLRFTRLHLFEADAELVSDKESMPFSPFKCCVATQQLANASVHQHWHWLLCNRTFCPVAALYDPVFNNATSARARKCAAMHAYKRAQPLPDVMHGTGFSFASLVSDVHILYW